MAEALGQEVLKKKHLHSVHLFTISSFYLLSFPPYLLFCILLLWYPSFGLLHGYIYLFICRTLYLKLFNIPVL